MQQRASSAHTRWECKYHVVFVPKYRRKILYGGVRKEVGRVLRRLCCCGERAFNTLRRNAKSASQRAFYSLLPVRILLLLPPHCHFWCHILTSALLPTC